MTIRVIGDLVTVRGWGFAGIDGTVAETAAEASQAIRSYLSQPDVGVILVAQSLADQLGGAFDEYKLRRDLPLVLNIPDSTGAGMQGEEIQTLLQQALGLRL
jgi:V/A-type H+-transporting ATPase subunit F